MAVVTSAAVNPFTTTEAVRVRLGVKQMVRVLDPPDTRLLSVIEAARKAWGAPLVACKTDPVTGVRRMGFTPELEARTVAGDVWPVLGLMSVNPKVTMSVVWMMAEFARGIRREPSL